jgi:uncharacterized iron-regulated protein
MRQSPIVKESVSRIIVSRVVMRSIFMLCFVSWLSASWLGLTSMACAADIPGRFSDTQGQLVATPDLVRQLAAADVVYLGETHDRAADHAVQLAMIQTLHDRQSNLTIGLEMFQRPYQPLLDRYIAGDLSEADLRDRSEYDARWGFDWELYAPILRYAKAEKIPLIALNTPTEVTRKVSRQGLNRLNWSDKRFIPPLSAIQTTPEAYRKMLAEIFTSMHPAGKTTDPARFERFFQAQVLWDETMAERIAQTPRPMTDRRSKTIVVLVGQGHLVYRYGIPDRVERRRSTLKQLVILLSEESGLDPVDGAGRPIADFHRIIEP